MNKILANTDSFKKKGRDLHDFKPESGGIAFNIDPLAGSFIIGNVLGIINATLLPVIFKTATTGGNCNGLAHKSSYGLKSTNSVKGYSIFPAPATA